MTGLSIDRVRQLRYVVELPEQWQSFIREGKIPLNFFWELKKNVIDPLANWRPDLLVELNEDAVMTAFVEKRLQNVITDTVSLRKVLPIVKFAAQDAQSNGTGRSAIDDSIRELVRNLETRIDDVYEDTVQVMVEADRLERRTISMVAAFARLLTQSGTDEERQRVRVVGRRLIDQLVVVLDDNSVQDGSAV